MKARQSPVLSASLGGLQAIEASAGTGKTWTICGLYLRLLLEKRVDARHILAITFTKAATAELRERIRARLRQALQALESDTPPKDPLLATLLSQAGDRAEARLRILAALCGFDEAPVQTIHGFCQRALADHAFSSKVAFDCALVPDIGELLHEIAADFWRREIADCRAAGPDPRAQRLLIGKLGAGALRRLEEWGLRYVRKEGLRVRPPERAARLDEALAGYVAAYDRCRELWLGDSDKITDLVVSSPSLRRNSYRSEYAKAWCAELATWFAEPIQEPPSLPPPGKVGLRQRFTQTRINEHSTKGKPPAHAFFMAMDAFLPVSTEAREALDRYWNTLRLAFLEYARAEIGRRFAERNAQSYDDLLLKLHAALQADDGGALVHGLRDRYRYALIDEFQDTDPLQWSIFRTIYADADPARHGAFLVGDPKQAIYSFRGADVYAYLDARSACGSPVRLQENHRSVPGLVESLNALFTSDERPFREVRIRYEPVTPADKARPVLWEGKQKDFAPLRIAWMGAGKNGNAHGAGEGREWATRATAAEIARLLRPESNVRLDGERLRAMDIAVLVNNHFQSTAMRAELARKGIGAAELSSESVFRTPEAEQLERLLLAAASPRDTGVVRAALATDCLGLDAHAIEALSDDMRCEEVLAEFDGYHETWRSHGPMRMLREMFRTRGVPQNLARFRDGERRLTNLYHLCELLHAHSLQASGMDAAIGWLSARRADLPNDDTMLRLESDANLVQIVTIHKSKGLEYPVTFVPFLWDARLRAGEDGMAVHHEQDAPHGLVLDAGSADYDQAVAAARDEELSERLRVAYVALTRAKNRCYLFTGAIRNLERSALGWLLHGIDGASPDASLPDAGTLRSQVEDLVKRAGGGVHAVEIDVGGGYQLPLPQLPPHMAARTPAQAVPAGLTLTSFSAMRERALARQETEPTRDYDAVELAAGEASAAGGGRFAFARGADAGTCLHAILERVDFCAADWGTVARDQLARAGYAASWAADVQGWLRETLDADLGGFRLAEVARAEQVRELPFQIAFRDFRPRRLVELTRSHRIPVTDLPGEKLRGYLGGFIDLVFRHQGRWYVADYKSNWLGPTADHYEAPALDAAMADGDYHLQYLLYTVALHRWLRHTVPGYEYERDFGGVRYLFLRGMHPAWGARGVFAARPSRELIEALDECLGVPAPGVAA